MYTAWVERAKDQMQKSRPNMYIAHSWKMQVQESRNQIINTMSKQFPTSCTKREFAKTFKNPNAIEIKIKSAGPNVKYSLKHWTQKILEDHARYVEAECAGGHRLNLHKVTNVVCQALAHLSQLQVSKWKAGKFNCDIKLQVSKLKTMENYPHITVGYWKTRYQ